MVLQIETIPENEKHFNFISKIETVYYFVENLLH
jgi:hypothetical protein